MFKKDIKILIVIMLVICLLINLAISSRIVSLLKNSLLINKNSQYHAIRNQNIAPIQLATSNPASTLTQMIPTQTRIHTCTPTSFREANQNPQLIPFPMTNQTSPGNSCFFRI